MKKLIFLLTLALSLVFTSCGDRHKAKSLVKDFLNETVSNLCIKDGLTTSILLKNGIELRFSYKTAE